MKIIKKLALVGLLATIALAGFNVRKTKNKTIEVPMSQIRYSQGETLNSKGFGPCSAVVLDYKDKAVMAHAPLPFKVAYQIMEEKGEKPCEYARLQKEWDDELHTENVVESLSNKLIEKGINPKDCSAFVNAGCKKGLEDITKSLEEKGIKIMDAKLDQKFRDIKYNPNKNKIYVEYKESASSEMFRFTN